MFNRGPKVSFVCSRALHQVTARDSRARHNVSGCRDVQVHVFDLAENKHEAMCDQKVVRKSKLTHIAFNPDPESAVVLVSDDRGGVLALKLSPNLRRTEVFCPLWLSQWHAHADVCQRVRKKE